MGEHPSEAFCSAQPAPKRQGVTPAPAARMARRKNLPLLAQSAALVAPVTVSLPNLPLSPTITGVFLNSGPQLAFAFIIQAGIWERVRTKQGHKKYMVLPGRAW